MIALLDLAPRRNTDTPGYRLRDADGVRDKAPVDGSTGVFHN
jgi:hypothetical protein